MSIFGMSGFKETVIGWIPETWECVRQSNVVKFHNGRAYKLTEWEAEGTPVIRLQNLTGSGDTYYYSNLNLPPHQYVNKGDLLFMWSATFGPHIWQGEKAIYHYHIWKIECSERIDRSYMFYSLSRFTDEMKNKTNGSTMLHLTKEGMEKETIALPPLPEQQKIAAILSAVDDKLDIIARQIEVTQTLKQGLMQTLFSRGVGTLDADGRWVPHTEFRESELGEIPVAWKVLSLNDVVETLDKKRVPLKQADRAQRRGKYPYYGASGVIDWIDDFIFDGDFILLGEDGENVISRNLPLAFRAKGKIWVNNHAHVFQPKAGFDIEFLVELLESLDYSHLASGTAQPKITQQALKQLRFAIPPFSEQKKIGSVLGEIERKQAVLRGKLSSYQTLKRGLMQKLLTGEWRVTADTQQEVALAA